MLLVVETPPNVPVDALIEETPFILPLFKYIDDVEIWQRHGRPNRF